jgi:hypothetical protein
MDAIPCPKCKSRSTHIAKVKPLYLNMLEDKIFSCRTCGLRIYGPERVDPLVAAHAARVQAEIEAEARALELLREPPSPPPKCAWLPCPKPPRLNSKYCGRTCSDRNAHHRAKERAALKMAGTP